MSLSNQDANQLRTRLERNSNLSVTSKTNLNSFIEKKKNAFDRSTFMQQYNAKMRNLRNRDASLGINSKRKRSRDNLKSAMENNTGTVSGGSVNPNKNGRMSPRGVLSGASSASNTSNNGNSASTNENLMAIARQVGQQAAEKNLERTAKRVKTQPQPSLVTAPQAAAANAKKKANAAKAAAAIQTVKNANAAKAAAPANSARVSATTLGSPNQSLNNNASSPLIIKPANKRNSKVRIGCRCSFNW